MEGQRFLDVWEPSLLAAPRFCTSNPAKGIVVGFILCLYNYLCILKNKKYKIHPCGMATLKNMLYLTYLYCLSTSAMTSKPRNRHNMGYINRFFSIPSKDFLFCFMIYFPLLFLLTPPPTA